MGVTESDIEDLKESFLGTDLRLLAVTFFVAVFHLVIDFLAFQTDIQFWRNTDKLNGISKNKEIITLAFETIILLYLKETGAIYYHIDTNVETKLRKTASDTVVQTEKYDSEITGKLLYLFLPLTLCYVVYNLFNYKYASFYAWLIESLASSVYVLGFVAMCPQLYVNYKLKSVEHISYQYLFYKFLNTIIDDLFAFVIVMPMLHRIACFRDDIIFVIYLYQRKIYKTDKTRGHPKTE
eukprot:snap_masked-scaffold_5-processed-gene-17.22-mRNA-1 protein AED:0.17 eAED:0.21 QI:0/0/0/1/1/1/3/0/237